MKRSLRTLGLLLAALLSVAMCSCGNDDDDIIIWDFSPVIIRMNIVDTDSNNLLDPDTPGNILDSGVTATFDGKEYQLKVRQDGELLSREYLAHFYGLYATSESFLNEDNELFFVNMLCFGEFQGFDNFDHTVTFHFPSAGRDVTVRVVSQAQWKGNTPDWTVDYYLDGRLLEGEERHEPIKIVF